MTALIGRTATLRELVTLAWPILVSMLSITIMSIVDTLFVSALGTLALASLGLALPVVYLVLSFPMGPLSAVKIVAAQATGAGEERRARALGWQSLWLALGLGLVAILLTPVAWLVLDLLAEGADSAWLARTFCSVRLVSAPLTFASLGLTGWFQGRGDTRTPMVAVLLANATNIALDPVLIFGLGPIPALGVGGAALATNLAEVVGCAVLLGRGLAELRLGGWRLSRSLIAEVMRIGLPVGVRSALETAGWCTFMGILASVGGAELAAHVLVLRILRLSFLPGHAIGQATSVMVGQAVGAKTPRQATRSWHAGLLLAVVVMGCWAVAFAALPDALLGIFGPEPEVLAVGRRLLLLAAAFQVFDAFATVSLCTLNGAADTRFSLFASLLASWFIQVPVAGYLVFVLELGAEGAWLGLTAEILVLAVIATARVRWLFGPSRVARGAVVAA